MITAAVICLTVVYLYERIRPLILRWMSTLESRAKPVKVVELPHDLKMIAMAEGEGWAQEQAEQRMRELYHDLGDWAGVRDFVIPGASR